MSKFKFQSSHQLQGRSSKFGMENLIPGAALKPSADKSATSFSNSHPDAVRRWQPLS